MSVVKIDQAAKDFLKLLNKERFEIVSIYNGEGDVKDECFEYYSSISAAGNDRFINARFMLHLSDNEGYIKVNYKDIDHPEMNIGEFRDFLKYTFEQDS